MKKCLIVIDYQNDFVDGVLGFEKAETIEQRIVKKLIDSKEEGTDIIFTLDTHHSDYLTTLEGIKLPLEHCIENSHGHELYGQVKAFLKDAKVIFKKDTFGSLELGNYLRSEKYDVVEIVGLVTHMCVLSNAVITKAALPNADIRVDSKACESFDPKLHAYTLEVLEGIHVQVI